MSQLLLIVRLAGERVALPAAEVEAVVEIEALTPVPRAAPHVAGLAALRSRVVTVVDGNAAFGSAFAAETREAVLVVRDGHPYAILVEGVDDVVASSGATRSASGALAPAWRRIAGGIVEAEGDLLLLVDPGTLIDGPAAAAA